MERLPMERLHDELGRWSAEGRLLALWWRDDDAIAPTPALDRLLAAARRHGAPLALAVIPSRVEDDLAGRLVGEPVHVLQHGFSHTNHALPGGRAVECGGRDTADILAEFGEGRRRLEALFAGRFLPVMVPPWNRIEGRMRERLGEAGYRGLSTFGRESYLAARGLIEVNAHLDILRWKPGPHFAGHDKLLAAMTDELAIRRAGSDERPFGLLTHHLVHDEASWRFLDALLALMAGHPAVRWADASALFSGGPHA